MNNGYSVDVVHPELAEVSDAGSLYVHEPAADSVAGLIACDIRNICTLTELRSATST